MAKEHEARKGITGNRSGRVLISAGLFLVPKGMTGPSQIHHFGNENETGTEYGVTSACVIVWGDTHTPFCCK